MAKSDLNLKAELPAKLSDWPDEPKTAMAQLILSLMERRRQKTEAPCS